MTDGTAGGVHGEDLTRTPSKVGAITQRLWSSVFVKGAVVLVGLIALTLVLESLVALDSQSWLVAVQAAATITVAAATVAYVALTSRLVRMQTDLLMEGRAAREDEVLAQLADFLQGDAWETLHAVSNAFNSSRDEPVEFMRDAGEVVERLARVQQRLLTFARQGPPAFSPALAKLADQFNYLSGCMVVLMSAIIEAVQVAEHGSPTWDDVRTSYMLKVREPEGSSWRSAEWDEVSSPSMKVLYNRLSEIAEACRLVLQGRTPGQRLT